MLERVDGKPPAGGHTVTLFLVRHGQTVWNHEHRYQGQSDVPLSEEGRRQASLLAERLANASREVPFDAIWSSDLARARETAEAAAQVLGLPVRLHSGLREMNFGAWEGLTFPEIEKSFPENVAAYRRDPVRTAPEGGESFLQVQARVVAAMEGILRGGCRRPLIVAHGGSLKAWLALRFGWDPAERHRMLMGNTGLTVVTAQGRRLRLLTYNDTAHLEVWPGRRPDGEGRT